MSAPFTITRDIANGDKGFQVTRIQLFLIGRKLYTGAADGDYGPKTEAAVKAYQKGRKIAETGAVDNTTIGMMLADGLYFLGPYREAGVPASDSAFPPADQGSVVLLPVPESYEEFLDISRPGFPPAPPFAALTSNEARASVFGKFTYRAAPTKDNPEAVDIDDRWESGNLETFEIPQLTKVLGRTGRVTFHKLAKAQLLALWAEWELKGLLRKVVSYEGAYVPRFVRGSRTTLSNHAFGTAFDINYDKNMLGHVPAAVGIIGSVRELVPTAHKHGFYWGGHFSRMDGMHFEVAVPLKPGEWLEVNYAEKTFVRKVS